ncbi:MAG TPA: Cof-type HAD-IIB family hydrolase [Candidatus Sulfotelmatobacter sp.]|nr:Cof-type HAD-IIB family hydrolase [Candidatus Sulfotelmatobacter sp.]
MTGRRVRTRPEPPIRLLASDLDGTLVGDDLIIQPRVADAVAAAMACGVIVVIATGRMYRSSVRFARALDLRAPLICYQGAYVREPPLDGEAPPAPIRHVTLAPDVAREAIRWSREHGLDPHVNLDDRLVMERGDEGGADYERLSGIDAEFVPDLVASVVRPVTKVLAVGPPGVPEAAFAPGRAAFAGRAEVTVSHPEYLEFTAPGVTKGQALRWLARRLRIPMAATMALGDQFNDLEMLAAAGHGVAMAGAPPEVRAAARHVTSSVAEGGAATAIEALILGRGRLPEPS